MFRQWLVLFDSRRRICGASRLVVPTDAKFQRIADSYAQQRLGKTVRIWDGAIVENVYPVSNIARPIPTVVGDGVNESRSVSTSPSLDSASPPAPDSCPKTL